MSVFQAPRLIIRGQEQHRLKYEANSSVSDQSTIMACNAIIWLSLPQLFDKLQVLTRRDLFCSFFAIFMLFLVCVFFCITFSITSMHKSLFKKQRSLLFHIKILNILNKNNNPAAFPFMTQFSALKLMLFFGSLTKNSKKIAKKKSKKDLVGKETQIAEYLSF